MAQGSAIIGFAQWLQTPPGRYLLEWEQRHLDAAVADVFGFHALQLGMSELDALRANRMPHRWVAGEGAPIADESVEGEEPLPRARFALHCDFDALPFASASLDLLVLPHTLERARDPHQVLREVERVLLPEGRVVVVGFNPASLWGLRQRLGHVRRFFAPRRPALFLPGEGEFLGYRRLRDWLRLLSFEVEAGRFGCYRAPVRSQKWLDRFAWMEHSGERWWPVFGSVYFVVAVKRVRGMRLVGLAKTTRAHAKSPAPAVAVNQNRQKRKDNT